MKEEKIEKEEMKKIRKIMEKAFCRMHDNLEQESREAKKKLKNQENLAELLFEVVPKTPYNNCFKSGYYINKKHNKIMHAINTLGGCDELDESLAYKFLSVFSEIEKIYDKAIKDLKIDEIIECDNDDCDEDNDDE